MHPATADDTPARNEAEPATEPAPRDIIPVDGGFDIYLENDSLAIGQHERTDRFYTSGVRLKFNSSQLRSGPVNAGPPLADRLVNGLLRYDTYRHRAFVVGQNFYTPADVTVPTLLAADRPYAGWLYAGLVWTGFRPTPARRDTAAARRRDRSESVELDLGVVGPLSQAEAVQKWVHNAIGSRPPKGWNNQLKNEPGIVLSYQRSRRPIFIGSTRSFGLDVTTLAGADAGNVFTQAKLGATVRFGYNVPRDFHAGEIIGPTFMNLNALEPAADSAGADGAAPAAAGAAGTDAVAPE
jgi:hypothetical protein